MGSTVRLRFQRRLSAPELDESMEFPGSQNVSTPTTPIPNAVVDEETPRPIDKQQPVVDEVDNTESNLLPQGTT